MDTAKILGQHLALLRDRAGLTQKEAAERAGIHLRSLVDIEQGASNPRLDTLTQIASALGVTLTAIFEPWRRGDEHAEEDVMTRKVRVLMGSERMRGAVVTFLNALYKDLQRSNNE